MSLKILVHDWVELVEAGDAELITEVKTMITEHDVEKALGHMRAEAANLGKAKADRVYLDQFRKSKKAILFSECEDGTVAAKENYAYAHPDYLEVLEGLKVAVETEETLRWKMVAAEAYVEVWRTQQANNRVLDRSHQ